jgi:UDP-N-acetylglucosamine 1-carboxyvinyltransferase
MAALFAKGTTTIHNAAKEPEIVDLCRCLEKMGAVIEGVGSSTLIIEGRQSLHGAQHHALPDRIETGSYIMAAAITGGDLFLEGATLDHLPTFDTLCREMGIGLFAENGGVRVKSPPPKDLKSLHITTEPFPGFPTDLQAQFMTLQTLTPGETEIHETIFENRMMHVAELRRMGANITLEGRKARVKGVNRLKGAPVMATDLRASKSLILAGLAADGETLINRMYHLDRGYHDLEGKLAACGAEIERFPGDEAPLIQRNLKKQASQSP